MCAHRTLGHSAWRVPWWGGDSGIAAPGDMLDTRGRPREAYHSATPQNTGTHAGSQEEAVGDRATVGRQLVSVHQHEVAWDVLSGR